MRRLYLALAAAGAFLLLPLGLALSTCSTPPDPLKVSNSRPLNPSPATVSTAQATATASQAVRVTITRKPTAQEPLQATNGDRLGGLSLDDRQGGSTAPTEAETITIEVAQDTTAAATVQASAELDKDNGNADAIQFLDNSVDNSHARIGVIAATMPGILAVDYQLASLDVPPWLLGAPLELGLDAAANLEAGALGVTAGRKAFAGIYGWSRWDLSDQGVAVGVGMRF